MCLPNVTGNQHAVSFVVSQRSDKGLDLRIPEKLQMDVVQPDCLHLHASGRLRARRLYAVSLLSAFLDGLFEPINDFDPKIYECSRKEINNCHRKEQHSDTSFRISSEIINQTFRSEPHSYKGNDQRIQKVGSYTVEILAPKS